MRSRIIALIAGILVYGFLAVYFFENTQLLLWMTIVFDIYIVYVTILSFLKMALPKSDTLREFWFELKRQKIGIAGLILLFTLIGAVVAFPLLANPSDIDRWHDQGYWREKMTPKLAPPAWVNWFVSDKYPSTRDLKAPVKFRESYDFNDTSQLSEFLYRLSGKRIEHPKILEKFRKSLWYDKFVVISVVYEYNYTAYHRPIDIVFRARFDIGNIFYPGKPQGVGIYIHRPDNITLSLIPGYHYPVNKYSINEYADFSSKEILELLGIPYSMANQTIYINTTKDWFFSLQQYGTKLSNYQHGLGIGMSLEPILQVSNETLQPGQSVDFLTVVFSKTGKGVVSGATGPLHGTYKFEFIFVFRLAGEDAKHEPDIEFIEARVHGVYGILGTDDKGRDLWAGLVYGVRWALLIGLITAFLATMLGVTYGMVSAYAGGLVDAFMQRFAQVMYSLPVLPLLIMLAYFFGKCIWIIIVLLVIFGWVGIQFVVRSMVLQIKEQTYIEAARALGAGDRRILFRYIFPQLIPYAFATMALNVPSAILAEAGLSFLGLGDPSIVTWGKILHEAQKASAVLKNAWWWVVPPGLAIAVTALTFVMIGMALERIIEPRLKTR